MLSKKGAWILIASIPIYMSLAFYSPSLISSLSTTANLSQLFRLAKANIRNQLSAAITPIDNLSTSSMTSANKIVLRRSQERGHADLKTFHTFSFAMSVVSA